MFLGGKRSVLDQVRLKSVGGDEKGDWVEQLGPWHPWSRTVLATSTGVYSISAKGLRVFCVGKRCFLLRRPGLTGSLRPGWPKCFLQVAWVCPTLPHWASKNCGDHNVFDKSSGTDPEWPPNLICHRVPRMRKSRNRVGLTWPPRRNSKAPLA